jgi:hypothetical protein
MITKTGNVDLDGTASALLNDAVQIKLSMLQTETAGSELGGI